MKAEELMIGDFVYYSSKNHIVQVVGMSGIRYSFNQQDVILYGDCFKDFDGRGTWESHTTKSLSPIPLTPEILEKNGFVRHAYGYSFNTLKLQGNLTESNETYFTIPISGCDIRMNYIHELQHALRLCGIEKEIEL